MRIPEKTEKAAATLSTGTPGVGPVSSAELADNYYIASQWQLMWRKFRRHHLAQLGGSVMLVMAILSIFAGFFSPYDIYYRHRSYEYAPPTRIRVWDNGTLRRPFVYKLDQEMNDRYMDVFTEDTSVRLPVRFFYRGSDYKLLGFIPTNIHLFGVDEPGLLFVFGTDNLGRDVFSRILHAARISLSIGLIGVAISFILGCILGGLSGYYGGAVDMVVQRIIELLNGIPSLPLWMALSAALPPDWPILRVYFGITVILSILGWTGLARVIRSRLLANRTEDYVLAAKIAGAKEIRIITRHLLPSMASHLIVALTLRIPGMILGETALSFLGIGLRPPAVSWGVLLQQAQNVRTVALYPWLMIPGLFVIIVVLAFNFLGDGLRDAADPYK